MRAMDEPEIRHGTKEARLVLEQQIDDGVVASPRIVRIGADGVAVEDVNVVVVPLVTLKAERCAHENTEQCTSWTIRRAPGRRMRAISREESQWVSEIVDHVHADHEILRRSFERRRKRVNSPSRRASRDRRKSVSRRFRQRMNSRLSPAPQPTSMPASSGQIKRFIHE